MAYRCEDVHEFIDLSKRKPYICAVCLRDIRHPIHQPTLEGITAKPTTTPHVDDAEPAERYVYVAPQLALF